jgi:hypothetical protein
MANTNQNLPNNIFPANLNAGSSISGTTITASNGNIPMINHFMNHFINLPLELQIQIVDYMDMGTFIRFFLANYSRLQRGWSDHLPPIPPTTYMNLVSTQQANLGLMQMLPAELILNIMNRIQRQDLMAFVLANYKLLVNKLIVDTLTDADKRELRLAMDSRNT